MRFAKLVALSLSVFALLCPASVGGQGEAGANITLPPNKHVASPAEDEFYKAADSYIIELFRLNPDRGTNEGIHAFDKELDTSSAESVQRQVGIYENYLAKFQAMKPESLSTPAKVDLQLVLDDLRSRLLELKEVRMWERNPDVYSSAASSNIFSLMKRDFAPLEERLQSVISRERKIPELLANGRKNVKNPPRIYTLVALEQLPGIIDFFQTSVPKAFESVQNADLQRQFKESNDNVIKELRDYQTFLQKDMLPRSNGSFAIGPDLFKKKLAYEEMVDESLPDLLNRGQAELTRLQQEFLKTAKSIDPRQPPLKVFAQVSADHPKPAELVSSVRDVLENIRKYCVEKPICTIPSEERVRVDETPPFERALTFASMDTPGPYEQKAKEAYYFVTLPDPTWTASKAEEHMRSFSKLDLLNTSIHEAYPGHYVQFLWGKLLPTNVRKEMGCGSNAEGWAHYCEQMMLDEGFGNGDPKLRLVQLHDALLRVSRYMVGIKMHTQNMSLDQGIAYFMKEGYQERANAEREAKRGTSDPTYLMYTLGKMQILALRDDYRKMKGADFSLKEFHDRFLSLGYPPLKLVRAEMLPADK
jgi:uncharacterized protein (DUF885 family)